MNSTIANENLQTLNDLMPFTKLKADAEGRLTYEDRYFHQVRRALTNDSREQLLSLLKQTFDLSEEDAEVKLKVLMKLRPVLTDTYPGYTLLQEVFDELIVAFGGKIETTVEESKVGPDTTLTIEQPVLLFDLDSLNLKQSDVNTSHVSMTEDGLCVTTNKSRNGYLLSSKPISVSGLKQLDVLFQVTINKGGFGVGLLDTNGNWVPDCYKNFTRRGFVEGSITLPVDSDNGNVNVMLVFYNCCSPADISKIRIEQISCYGVY